MIFNGLQTIVKINGKMACHLNGNMADCFQSKVIQLRSALQAEKLYPVSDLVKCKIYGKSNGMGPLRPASNPRRHSSPRDPPSGGVQLQIGGNARRMERNLHRRDGGGYQRDFRGIKTLPGERPRNRHEIKKNNSAPSI